MKRELQYLVIHCTATPAGREVLSSDIRRWHTALPPQGRGWKQVGYTDIIHVNGGVERMVENNEDGYVDSWEITNGVAGKNSISRHVCYVGGMTADGKKPFDSRTKMQQESMKKYVQQLRREFPNLKIVGHRELDPNKSCPSFDVAAWLRTF